MARPFRIQYRLPGKEKGKCWVRFCALTAFLLAGCGAQRGRFVCSGDNCHSFSSAPGYIDIVRGYEAGAFGRIRGPEKNLLFIVTVCPGATSGRSSQHSSYDKYKTTLSFDWTRSGRSLTARVTWNRQQDKILAGRSEFSRTNGNVILVVLQPDGSANARQLPNLDDAACFEDVLRTLHEHPGDDPLIASLQLYKAPN